ncbi:MAG: AAC(3) family N-acetyltransferase [Rhodospirillales bacterium]
MLKPLLDALDLPPAPLVVHCAFRDLGRAGIGADAAIEFLVERIAPATLLMPAMTWRNVTREAPLFDARSTPGVTGHLGEVFRTRWAETRSVHPTHSTCAMGRDADWFTAGHHTSRTPCDPDSPYGRLVIADGWCLMIGIGLECCTVFHCAEEASNPDVFLRPEVEPYTCIDLMGKSHQVAIRRHTRDRRDFPKFTDRLRAAGGLREARAGDVRAIAVRARSIVDIVGAALARDERATLAAEPGSAQPPAPLSDSSSQIE